MTIQRPLVLASRSPRRIALLRQIGMHAVVVPGDIPEVFDDNDTVPGNACRLALAKARTVAADVADAIVIGADTIVAIDHHVLGKPEDRQDAIRMLTLLSGRTHTVVTAFALIDRPSECERVAFEETRVTFRDLPADEIADYAGTGSPMDKAGGYGIQDDYGAVFVSRVDGCYYNVVGLPLSRLYTTLREFSTMVRTQGGSHGS